MRARRTKYIFVTGGVVSSLGKGLASASIGALLENRGLEITHLKLDPYINVDPGTMSPIQHGEVFVTDDGAETDLVEYWGEEALRADVLKVGHHGSDTSTSYRFLRAVAPGYAVISVGAGNKYGHPTPETLKILKDAEVYVYRTDTMGTVVAVSDGENITFGWVNTQVAPAIGDTE